MSHYRSYKLHSNICFPIEGFRCTRAPNYCWKLSSTRRGICHELTKRRSVCSRGHRFCVCVILQFIVKNLLLVVIESYNQNILKNKTITQCKHYERCTKWGSCYSPPSAFLWGMYSTRGLRVMRCGKARPLPA